MECEWDVIEGLSFFLFLYYAYSIILNDRLCRMYLFFSAALFTVLTAKMLNEFSILTGLIKYILG